MALLLVLSGCGEKEEPATTGPVVQQTTTGTETTTTSTTGQTDQQLTVAVPGHGDDDDVGLPSSRGVVGTTDRRGQGGGGLGGPVCVTGAKHYPQPGQTEPLSQPAPLLTGAAEDGHHGR